MLILFSAMYNCRMVYLLKFSGIVWLTSPVIFVTAFDEFMMNAFEYNGIDYLLKPVDEKELDKALKKYKMLQHHFAGKTMI